MKIDEIMLLNDYNNWADAQLLAACARVSLLSSTLPHTPMGMEDYAQRWSTFWITSGSSGSHFRDFTRNLWQMMQLMMRRSFTKTPFQHSPLLQERWIIEQEEMRAYLDTLTEDRLMV